MSEPRLEGTCGHAFPLAVKDEPAYSETVCWYLITAAVFHPLWSQYILTVVRLRDNMPGFRPPERQFDGATHELLVVALNPEHGPYDPQTLERVATTEGLPYLTPVNIAHQVEGTDEEMLTLADLAVRAVLNGHLVPETADAPDRIREAWKTSLVKTLAHIRGEAHAT